MYTILFFRWLCNLVVISTIFKEDNYTWIWNDKDASVLFIASLQNQKLRWVAPLITMACFERWWNTMSAIQQTRNEHRSHFVVMYPAHPSFCIILQQTNSLIDIVLTVPRPQKTWIAFKKMLFRHTSLLVHHPSATIWVVLNLPLESAQGLEADFSAISEAFAKSQTSLIKRNQPERLASEPSSCCLMAERCLKMVFP